MAKSRLRFLDEESTFLSDSYQALRHHFDNQADFLAQYRRISDASLRDRFLKISSSYKILVRDALPSDGSSAEDPIQEYVIATFKFISIMSLIEGLFQRDEFLDFFQWLHKKENSSNFPISSRKELADIHSAYKDVYGSRRNAQKFFAALGQDVQSFLKSRLKMFRIPKDWGPAQVVDSPADELAKLLYDIRSEFVHQAELIILLDGASVFDVNRKKPFISKLSPDDFCLIFEHGLLEHFGFSSNGKQLRILLSGD